MEKQKSLKKNYIFNLIYQITSIIVPLIVTPYVSRVLLADGIGSYSFSVSIITYFTIFASLGFELYAQREIAKVQDDKQKQTQVFWEIVLCRGVFVVISIIVNSILIFTGVYGKYTLLMKILIINIVAVGFDINFFFEGNEEFKKIALRNLFVKLTAMALIFLLVKKKGDLWLYTLINAGMVLVGNLTLWPALSKRLCKIKLLTIKPSRQLYGTLKLFIPALAIILYNVIDKSLIGIITKIDSENGVYEQAEKIVKIAMTLITCLGAVMAARNAHEIEIGKKENAYINVYKSCNFVWLFGLPMTIGVILISDNVVPWFLGPGFEKSAILLKIFAPLILIIGLNNIFGRQYLVPSKMDKNYTIPIIIGAIINIIANIPLIYYFSSIGAAIATILAESFVTILMFVFVLKDLSAKEILKTAIKPAIATFVMFACIYPITFFISSGIWQTFLLISSAAIVYFFTILMLKEPFTLHLLKTFYAKFKKSKKE